MQRLQCSIHNGTIWNLDLVEDNVVLSVKKCKIQIVFFIVSYKQEMSKSLLQETTNDSINSWVNS